MKKYGIKNKTTHKKYEQNVQKKNKILSIKP